MEKNLATRLRRLLWTPVRLEARRHAARWRRALERADEVQEQLVADLIEQVRGSDFARDFGLDVVGSREDLRRALPVADYERVRPYIDRVREGDTTALFAPDVRIHMFALTSGTTGSPKHIPVTDRLLKTYRQGWHVWGVHALEDHDDAFGARVLQLTGRFDECLTPSGIPAGAMSGLTARAQRRSVRWLYVVPPETCLALDTPSKYYVACRMALRARRVLPLTANPSTLIGLARAMDAEKAALVRDVADGTLRADLRLPPAARRRLEARLRPNRRRARELDAIFRATGHLLPKDVWHLPLIGAWKGGTMGLYLREMPATWGHAPVRDIGLVASEGRFTVPVQTEGSEGVLDVCAAVYEFLPEEEEGKPDPATLLPHEVEAGGRYYLVPTTVGGLFRYHIGDLVEVVQKLGRVPVLRFLSKGAHTTSLTGEKLTEHQVVEAVNAEAEAAGLRLASYALCPTWDEVPYYSLLVEDRDVDAATGPALAGAVDRRLRKLNIEYDAKRASGRLRPVRVKTIPDGAWEGYDRQQTEAGSGRIEQYKHTFLHGDVSFESTFALLATHEPPGRDEL